MKILQIDAQHPHSERARLRAIVADIDRELSVLSRPTTRDDLHATGVELRSSWDELVGLLDLGPVPEARVCPVCHRLGMRDATRCGYCWNPLAPFGDASLPQ
jgi:hypothetical protein